MSWGGAEEEGEFQEDSERSVEPNMRLDPRTPRS